MNRDEWKFHYSAADLFDAAVSKKAFHSGRVTWWGDKRKETEEKIRSEGIEIDDSVAAGSSVYANSTAQRGPSVSIRNDLLRDLNECVAKINEHRAKIKDYGAWEQVLGAQKHVSLELHQDDWLFFFGK